MAFNMPKNKKAIDIRADGAPTTLKGIRKQVKAELAKDYMSTKEATTQHGISSAMLEKGQNNRARLGA